ncbi:NERD domain-containing protein [Clostridium sp. Sa3CUN1]|uniref:NERD domain-containing protein n=1 Tax=Clostridium gallinarum TaxID=2762246 RepID=A0ABR8Q5P5_9CLOT|nr:nuclease-related domain-containing protein [Clostridium gallinarum]MBD7915757.1 NERD domain-containing protein [Clostridium gallinarum]
MNILLILLILIIILISINRKRKKINPGEKEVKDILSRIKGYKLLNDIMIKSNNGTSQIDHILIGKKGIFVIETKDYSGMIYGDEYSREWTQVINSKKNKFYNPIRQNYGHIKTLEKHIDRKNIFISIIVFTNKSTLKKIETDTPVIQVKKLKRFIRKYKSNNMLTKEEIDNMYNLIKKNNINSNRERKKHVKRISRIIS